MTVWFRKRQAARTNEDAYRDGLKAGMRLRHGCAYWIPALGRAGLYERTYNPAESLLGLERIWRRGVPVVEATHIFYVPDGAPFSCTSQELDGVELIHAAPPVNTWTPDPVAVDPR